MDGRPFGLQSGLRMGREKRETCRKGTTFYSCENGFRGCCNVDPCGPEGGCANSGSPVPTTEALGAPVSYVPASTSPHPTSTRANNITGSTSTPESTTTTFAISASLRPTPIPPAISTENASTSSFASSVSSKLIPSPSQSLSSTTSAPAVPLVPACPASNGTAFTDKSQIEYTVHCFVSNSYPPDHTIATSNSEYGECFASCSSSSTCAGFTYAPLDDGVCYLKSQMPKNLYMLENGLISYEKVNSSSVTAAPTTTPSQESGTKKSGNSSWSEIVGPVVAVVALTLLILLGVAFFVRARRKKARKRRVPFARGGIGGPVEINRSPSEKEEGNSRHISNGVFAPYGGFIRGFDQASHLGSNVDHGANNDTQREQSPLQDSTATPSEVHGESRTMLLPAMVYNPSHIRPHSEQVAMLDGRPISYPNHQAPGLRPRCSRSEVAEMPDTSPNPNLKQGQRLTSVSAYADSPTLGRSSAASNKATSLVDKFRQATHLMSWNMYDGKQASRKDGTEELLTATLTPNTTPNPNNSPKQVSPDMNSGTPETTFYLSPARYECGGKGRSKRSA